MSVIKGVIVKATSPTILDDVTKGFYIGFRWVDTVSLRVFTCTSNTLNNAKWVTGIGIFSQTAQSAIITNTVTESTIVGTGTGSLTFPANTFTVGNSYAMKMGGLMSSLNNVTIRIRIKSNGNILADTGVVTLPAITNKFWEIELDLTVRAIGAATVASLLTNGQFVYVKDASNAYEGAGFNLLNTATFDTTISNTINVTIEWGAASASNSISSDSFVMWNTY